MSSTQFSDPELCDPLLRPANTCVSWKPEYTFWVTCLLLFIGCVLRIERYLLCIPLWHDELCLTDSLIGWHSYADAFAPLGNCQVAPPLFLCIEWTSINLLGVSEYSLRLFPLLAGLIAMLLIWRLLEITFGDFVAMIGTGIFAVSETVMDHVAEVKPYSSDVASSLLLLIIAVNLLVKPDRIRIWIWLAFVTPLAIGLSFPSIFTVACVHLTLLFYQLRHSRKVLIANVVCGTISLTAFVVAYLAFIQPQMQYTHHGMQSYWQDGFIPLENPGEIPLWILQTLTGEVFAYPIGGADGLSVLTLLTFGIGVYALVKRSSKKLLVLFLLPMLVAFLAAGLKKYPLGPAGRVSLYLAPIIIALSAVGVAQCIVWWQERMANSRLLATYLLFLCLIGGGAWVTNLIQASKSKPEWQYQTFARWFWNASPNENLICAVTDLGAELPSVPIWYRTSQAMHWEREQEWQQFSGGEESSEQVFRIAVPRDQNKTTATESWNSVVSEIPFPFEVIDKDQYSVTSRFAMSSVDVYTIKRLAAEPELLNPRTPEFKSLKGSAGGNE